MAAILAFDFLADEDRRVLFEKRRGTRITTDEAQHRLRKAITYALAHRENTLINAPTGPGKTHAIATTPWREHPEMNRRTFTKLVGVSVAGASLPGCIGAEPDTGNAESGLTLPTPRSEPTQKREIEERVRFINPRWRSVGVEDVWGIQTEVENLSGESLWVECVLIVGGERYTGVVGLEPWTSKTIVIPTHIPDTDPEPTDFELIPVTVDEPVTPTPVPDPESYVRIVESRFEPDSIMPMIRGVVENISKAQLGRVVVRGTFYVGNRAAEASNVVERDMRPGEVREISIRYFQGNEAQQVDGHEAEVVEVVL